MKIRNQFGFVVGLLCFAAPQISSAQGFKVLLTSFDPFGGSPQNNTQPIVAELKAQAASLGADVTVETCNLPVVYDTGAKTAMQCVSRVSPDAVVSFGEAGCSLLIETAATNQDDTPGFPDNAGQDRDGSAIIQGGPDRSGFNFPVQAMFCALNASSAPVIVSTSPGAFVCNNVAYHLSQNLASTGTPFTFVHVPNSQCSDSEKDPKANARTIAQMLSAAIASIRTPLVPNSPWPHSGNSNLLPRTREEASALLQTLQAQRAPACEVSFSQSILSAY